MPYSTINRIPNFRHRWKLDGCFSGAIRRDKPSALFGGQWVFPVTAFEGDWPGTTACCEPPPPPGFSATGIVGFHADAINFANDGLIFISTWSRQKLYSDLSHAEWWLQHQSADGTTLFCIAYCDAKCNKYLGASFIYCSTLLSHREAGMVRKTTVTQ